MWWNLLYSLMGYGDAIFSVFMIILLFAFLYGWLLPANEGTKMGIGVGGIFGMISFASRNLNLYIGIALGGTLGGFIGSAIQGPFGLHLQGIREAEQRMLNQQRESNAQRMLNQQRMLNEQRRLNEQRMLNEPRFKGAIMWK